ncbi:MAG: transporter [Burkholderiales bacterium]|nr:MAG: transporter [Burkholderiales bacterium]
MKTSARNCLNGIVRAITSGAVNDEIELEVAGGHTVVATVTRHSTQSLGLAAGSPAFALVKASSIILMADCSRIRLSARNQFTGRVRQWVEGAVNSEVTLEVAPGLEFTAIVTRASAQELGVAEGIELTAVFKASSVLLGVES